MTKRFEAKYLRSGWAVVDTKKMAVRCYCHSEAEAIGTAASLNAKISKAKTE